MEPPLEDVVGHPTAEQYSHKIVRDLVQVIVQPSILRESGIIDDPLRYPSSRWLEKLVTSARPWLRSIEENPALVTDFITAFPRVKFSVSRLGRYYALLLEFWVRYCPALQLSRGPTASDRDVARFASWGGSKILGTQIARPTHGIVGALKFLFLHESERSSSSSVISGEDGEDGEQASRYRLQWKHWEASFKIFVAAPSADATDSLHGFVGPFLHETMAMRVTTARRKLALSSAASVQSWLRQRRSHAAAASARFLGVEEYGVDEAGKGAAHPLVVSELVLKGLICYPIHDWLEYILTNTGRCAMGSLPPSFNPHHRRGWWAESPAQLVRVLSASRSQRFTAAAAGDSAEDVDVEEDAEHRYAMLPKLHWISSVEAREGDALLGDEALGLDPVPLLREHELFAVLAEVAETADVTAVLVAELRRYTFRGRGWRRGSGSAGAESEEAERSRACEGWKEASRGFVSLIAVDEWDPKLIMARSMEAMSPASASTFRAAECAKVEDSEFVLPPPRPAAVARREEGEEEDKSAEPELNLPLFEELLAAAVREHELNHCANQSKSSRRNRPRGKSAAAGSGGVGGEPGAGAGAATTPRAKAVRRHHDERTLATTLRFHAHGGRVLLALLSAWSDRAAVVSTAAELQASLKHQRVAGHILLSLLQELCRNGAADITPRFGLSALPFEWESASQGIAPGRFVVTEDDVAAAAALASRYFEPSSSGATPSDVAPDQLALCPSLLNRAGLALAMHCDTRALWIEFDASNRVLLDLELTPLHASARVMQRFPLNRSLASHRTAAERWSATMKAQHFVPTSDQGVTFVLNWVLERGSSIESVCDMLLCWGMHFSRDALAVIIEAALNKNEPLVAEVCAALLPLEAEVSTAAADFATTPGEGDEALQAEVRWRLIVSAIEGARSRGLRSAKASKRALATRARTFAADVRKRGIGDDGDALLSRSGIAETLLPPQPLLRATITPLFIETVPELRTLTLRLRSMISRSEDDAEAGSRIVLVALDCEWQPRPKKRRSVSGAPPIKCDRNVQVIQVRLQTTF